MKFTAAIVAVTVASASAFSVTMSSIGYLSNLGSSGGLTSFAPPAGSAPAAPAPASYQAPAPAPAPAPAASTPAPASAPYVSGFANVAPSNGLNYLGGLGGGGSMKSGRNFSGVSSSFKPTNTGPSYLANLPGQVMQSTYGSAAAPAQPSYSQPAAPAPQPAAPAPAPLTQAPLPSRRHLRPRPPVATTWTTLEVAAAP